MLAMAVASMAGAASSRAEAGTDPTTPTTPTPAIPGGPSVRVTTSWTVYHGDPLGSGVGPTVAAVHTNAPAWRSPRLDGQLYGEPLVSGGQVYVATENDSVYALSSLTGAVIWSNHLASPVPSASLPCGDIQPTVGITGTPVIDPARGEIFAVADELVAGRPQHTLVGLSTSSGKLEMSEDVDPAGASTPALLQRTGLNLDGGRVVFGFGGNYGDCSRYRGWVVSAGEAGGPPADYGLDVGAGESQGAVWMGGAAPVVDGSGDIWVSVGNGSVTSSAHAYDYSDSVLELSSSLHLLQFFAPTEWAADNAGDADMSMAPVILSDGQVVIAGKSRIAYLLDAGHLGGIGGQLEELNSVCSDDVDGGGAVVGTSVYLPCLSGIVAVSTGSSSPSLHLDWSSGAGGGPPVVAAGLVWSIGQDGTLVGIDPTTGTVDQQANVGVPANHFPTPSVGDQLLLAPTAYQVVAFAAPAPGATGSTTTTTTTPVSSPPPATAVGASGGGLSAGELIAIIAGGAVAVAAAIWLFDRRRKERVDESE
jgi:outer membrane protein assembly factor BamB